MVTLRRELLNTQRHMGGFMKTRLGNTIERTIFAEQLELIPLDREGQRIELLRLKSMPELAFVMWSNEGQGTYTQLRFKLQDGGVSGHYTVVCACCGSEWYGLEYPDKEAKHDAPEVVAWRQDKAVEFKEVLVKTCKENGISVLFFRRASAWEKHYGITEGLEIVEAGEDKVIQAYLELYGKKRVYEAFRFIDSSSRF